MFTTLAPQGFIRWSRTRSQNFAQEVSKLKRRNNLHGRQWNFCDRFLAKSASLCRSVSHLNRNDVHWIVRIAE